MPKEVTFIHSWGMLSCVTPFLLGNMFCKIQASTDALHLFVCSPFGYSGSLHWSAWWHLLTILCTLWNVIEVGHHVGACVWVCGVDMFQCAPQPLCGSHHLAPDLPTSRQCMLSICVQMLVGGGWAWEQSLLKQQTGLSLSTRPYTMSGLLTCKTSYV